MAKKDWYTINDQGDQGFAVLKVSDEFDHLATYFVSRQPGNQAVCTCFAGAKFCRHKKMLAIFQEQDLVGKKKYYNFDKAIWYQPPKLEIM